MSDGYIVGRAALEPVMATFWGIPGHDHEWGDLSPTGWALRRDLALDTLRLIDGSRPDDRHERVATEVLRERLLVDVALLEAEEFQVHMSSLSGFHTHLREMFDFMARDTPDHWEAIRQRLDDVGAGLAGLRETYLDSATRGKVAMRSQTLVVAEQCALWAEPDGTFAELATACPHGDISAEAARAAAAFGDFSRWLRADYAAIASPVEGIGRDRYALHARLNNGIDLDLDETYRWGWDELHRINARMDEIATTVLGFATRADCIRSIERDERYTVPDGDAYISWSEATIARTFDALDGTVFDIPEVLRRCESMRIPSDLAGDAYYTPPTEDFSRPGMVWHPIDGRDHFPLWHALSTLFHESVPGHHLQLGEMMYRTGTLTRFQRMGVYIPGHGEGWALYAERLMRELGYLDEPPYELGYLVNQALRAARVVVDIGLHCHMTIPADESFHPGEPWTPALATEFLVANTAYDHVSARGEVDRYLGMPAQAISYKVGERVFTEGRRRVEQRLGDRFDLKRFHTQLLHQGAMGLDQLAAEFDHFTA